MMAYIEKKKKKKRKVRRTHIENLKELIQYFYCLQI